MDRLEREFGIRLVEDEEPGLFTGYASVFGVLDAYGTIFDKGAFKKTIKEHKGRLPITWMHQIEKPIGLAFVEEDDHGFLVKEGRLNLEVQSGAEVYSGMKFRDEGYITQMSHTFRVVKKKTVEEDGEETVHFKEVKSFEIAPVTTNFAANEEAVIISVRTEQEEFGLVPELNLRPYPNEHSCRVRDPKQFVRYFRKTVTDSKEKDGYKPTGKKYVLLIGYRKDDSSDVQAHRYPKDTWTSAQARKHCKAHDGKLFEPAKRAIYIPVGMAFQMGRLSALLREPPVGTPTGEPRRKPGDHLRELHEQITRVERVLKGGAS